MLNDSQKPSLIFDFDGTIADTLMLLVDISNRLADKFKFRKIFSEDIEILKSKNIMEVIHYLQVPTTKIPVIMYETRRQMRQHITEAPAAEGLKDIISQLHSLGHRMGIFSSNSRNNVDLFLQHNSMEFFDFFKTSVGLFEKKKRLEQLIREQKFNREQVIYVADEIRDIEAAQAIGVKIAAVTWGYYPPSALAGYKPDYLLDHPRQLLELLP